jgi:hypothetical protein
MASTYLSFLAPRLGATAGPCFFFAAAAVAEEDVVELEYVDAGRAADDGGGAEKSA